LRLAILFLITASFVVLSYGQSQETSTNQKNLVPYADNSDIEFTENGKINYDLLIAKVIPDIFVEKLHALGANITNQDIVLERGFHIAMYQLQSYNCGYAIDHQKNKVYWLEAAINSTHIQYANIYEELPRQDNSSFGYYEDCFALIEAKPAEIFLEEKSFFTEFEEKRAIAIVKHHFRGNDNLNIYPIKVGKFNYDYGNKDNLSICGEFVGRNAGSKYYSALLDTSGVLSFSLERKLSPLCAIDHNPTFYDIKFQNTPRDESLQPWKNIRHEQVYLHPESAEYLLERNYLRVESINSLNLEYASPLKVVDVEYQPESSNTTLKFPPFDKTSYMKVRVPEKGANYYFNYGDNEWNDGRLLWVSISIDGNETEYNTSQHVRSPDAPYPSRYTDFTFKVPANSTDVQVHLEIENYSFNPEEFDNSWVR